MDKWFADKLHIEKLKPVDGIFCSPDTGTSAGGGTFDDDAHDWLFKVEDSSFWFKHRNNVIINVMYKTPPPGNRMIEVGGGNGNSAHFLSTHGFNTAMFEPGVNGCRNALKRGLKNVVCSLMNSDYVNEQSIESIGLFDVIEHIEDDSGFLRELKNLLTEDGMLYITVPAHKILWSYSDVSHYRRYNRKSLSNTLGLSGYKVMYDTYFFWILPILIFLFRTLPYLLNKEEKKTDKAEFIIPAFIEKIVNILLRYELRRIRKGKRVPIGASLLVVAKKLD